MAEKQTKFIFVTGGVVSGLGKGITAASLGRLLKCRGLKVASQKLDPYVNVAPGTMSPLQHGEVFVTDDGTETDLDLGHYERFIDENLNKYSNLTTGKVYWNVLNKERQGAYLRQSEQITGAILAGEHAVAFWLGNIVVGSAVPAGLAALVMCGKVPAEKALAVAVIALVCAVIGTIVWRVLLYEVAVNALIQFQWALQ